MSDRFVEAFVDKLVLLEQKTGAEVGYRVMPPLTAPFPDCLAIQAVAKQIAEFVGLQGFTFIVAKVKQRDKVAGHIDLSTAGREVFIEVDSDFVNLPDLVAATLCHEVCHKWLQVNGIGSHIEMDNEILTDIASVFLGFGKIMLNGCRVEAVKQEAIPTGTRTTTATIAAGYLDREQLALVYRLVCAMRRIPSTDFMQGLNSEAALAVKKCDSAYGQHYDQRLHRMEATQELVTDFNNRVVEVQKTMADLDKHMTYIKKSFLITIETFLVGKHKILESRRQEAVAMTKDNEPDPCLHFLRNIQRDLEVKRLSKEVRSVSEEAEWLLRPAKGFGRQFSQSKERFPSPSPAMFNIVTCPIDGTKLRLPENSGDIIATCPKCGYRFAYNTNAVSFSEPPVPGKLTWWERIRCLMRRRKHEQSNH